MEQENGCYFNRVLFKPKETTCFQESLVKVPFKLNTRDIPLDQMDLWTRIPSWLPSQQIRTERNAEINNNKQSTLTIIFIQCFIA